MKENFWTSMLGEGGKISHKRWISVTAAAVLCWVVVYSTIMAKMSNERYAIIVATMVFILVMSGVATIPQIIKLFRAVKGVEDKDDKKENNE